MKQVQASKEFLILVLLLLPMAYLAIIWNSLPTVIPTDQDVSDQTGSRSAFLLLMIFLFVTNALIYALFRFVPKAEEGPTVVGGDQKEFYRSRFIIHIYLALFTCLIIFMVSLGQPFAMERWAFVGVGLLIAGIGLYLWKLQLEPNHYVGVRTPWTLQSKEIWRETHRMAGTLWVSAGVVMIIAGFFLSLVTGVFLIFFASMVLAALPYIYSFRLYNKDKG
ncbi:SdpI family protein [Chitinophaga qingshengii]|uniref:SdpI family protein n=1 Tax=Chitinophaga qingshengii TaxID=1569794 RepID=A0ABR7TVP5_9BACT|nr:SdpI family protein [Chitinophaga qingshengii]MBC9934567.1 SdpI family protein [Chitinophaga qingshengii]